MMYLCDWPERRSLLIDAASEKAAIAIATEVGEALPTKTRPIPPGLVVCELYADDDASGDEIVVLEAMPHVLDALGDLLDDDAPAPLLRIAPRAPAPARCASTAESKGALVRCDRTVNHGGLHMTPDLEWE